MRSLVRWAWVLAGLAGLSLSAVESPGSLPCVGNLSLHQLSSDDAEPWSVVILADVQDGFLYLPELFRRAAARHPRAVFLLGDLSMHPDAEHMALPVAEILAHPPPAPLFAVPGNHDIEGEKGRAEFLRWFGATTFDVRLGRTRFLGLENTRGTLTEADLREFKGKLDEASSRGERVVVCMHEGSRELLDLADSRDVPLFFAGHSHKPLDERRKRTRHVVAPASGDWSYDTGKGPVSFLVLRWSGREFSLETEQFDRDSLTEWKGEVLHVALAHVGPLFRRNPWLGAILLGVGVLLCSWRPKRIATFVVMLTLFKLAIAAELDLTSVETYYWMYEKHLAAGYFDHPGMIGWLVALSTGALGDSALGARWLTVLGGSAAVWLAFLTGRRLYGEAAGERAALLTGLVPLMLGYGSGITPDAPLLLFWTAAVWALAHVVSGDSPRWWYVAGLSFGLAMDSKYQAAFLGLGIAIFLIGNREWLARREPYVAAILAAAAFLPTVLWNARNGWQSFLYQGEARFLEGSFRARELVDFPVSQLALLTPFICVSAWWAGAKTLARWKTASPEDRLMAVIGMPILLFFAGIMFFRPVRGHWPAAGYVTLLVLAAARQTGPWTRRLHAVSLAVLGLAVLAAPAVVPSLAERYRGGWSALSRAVEQGRADFVVSGDYHVASQLAYRLRPFPSFDFTPLGLPSKSFPHWWQGGEFAGKDAMIVSREHDWPDDRRFVEACFAEVGVPVALSVERSGRKAETFLIVRARRYRTPY